MSEGLIKKEIDKEFFEGIQAYLEVKEQEDVVIRKKEQVLVKSAGTSVVPRQRPRGNVGGVPGDGKKSPSLRWVFPCFFFLENELM